MALPKKIDSDLPLVVAPHKCCGAMSGMDFGKKILLTLVGVLLVYLTFYVGTLMRNNIKKYDTIGQADQMERTITVTASGKVSAKNDIAVTTLGYTNIDKDVATAQKNNTKVVDQIMAELRTLGITDKDLQTNYSINPEYDYTADKGQVLKGYRVSSNVTVKIRDLGKITAILSLAGKYGANQVGGLTFTIDDQDALKDQARLKALVGAKQKAKILAQSLGVMLSDVVSYSDYEAQSGYPMYDKAAFSLGIGGAQPSAAPEDIAAGSKDVIMNVVVTYKIISPRW